jgi:penicillin-binding protein 2
VTALAGLQTGQIHPAEKVFCPGYYRLGTRNFDCWRKGGHGTVSLLEAIEQSCNVCFYRMGLKIGLDNWSEYAKRFGFGKVTGIDLPNESAGLVPSQEYFDQRYGRGRWSKGLILNLAFGQGDLLETPLQMACIAMTIANEGHSFRPRLKRGMLDPSSLKEEYEEPDSVTISGISPENYALVKRGMYLVVHGANGTARSSQVKGITAAGKTGTAQNPHGDSHAWFIGFAPFEDPQVAYCIFIENGGGGGATAAPFARKIVALLLEQQKLIIHPQRVDSAD